MIEQDCRHSTVDVSETWLANGRVRSVELPLEEVGTCCDCGKRIKLDENGPISQTGARKRGKTLH
jgi:hypothetical protein